MREMFVCLGKALIGSIPDLIKAIYRLNKAQKGRGVSKE